MLGDQASSFEGRVSGVAGFLAGPVSHIQLLPLGSPMTDLARAALLGSRLQSGSKHLCVAAASPAPVGHGVAQ